MITNFNEQLWIDFDLEIAVFIENLLVYLRINASKDNPEHRNFHKGYYWSYNSYPELAKLFPGWSSKTMRTIVARCIKYELILVDSFNKKTYDNTNWYTLTDKALAYFPKAAQTLRPASIVETNTPVEDLYTPAQTGIPPAQTGRPIPKSYNSLRNINITISDSEESPTTIVDVIIEAYHEVLPDSPKIVKADNKLKNQLKSMVKNWPKYSATKAKFTIEAFKKFMLAIKATQPRFLLPYTTPAGNVRRNNLRTITRDTNICKFINQEFNFN